MVVVVFDPSIWSICLSASLKTKLFCETSSIFELDNIKNAAFLWDFLNFCTWQHQNEAILRDILNFWSWQHQKRSNSARLLSNMESCAELTASYQCVLRFCLFSTCLKYCTCHEKVMPGHTKCCTCNAKSSHRTYNIDMMLQNATPLRKSAPGPNISDEHVSCIAPATRHASCQIHCKCPTPAIVFWNTTKTLTFWPLLATRRIPCTCHAERHLNIKKWSEHLVFLFFFIFWLQNVLRATTACSFSASQVPKVVRTWCALFWLGNVLRATKTCTFSTSQLPKVLHTWGAFSLFTCKCAFAPQRRTLFRQLNCQKWAENGVFCTFWSPNVIRATTACNFSSLIWPDGSAPAALASLFHPPEPQVIGKTQCVATFLPFRAPASSFFWLFLFSDLLSCALLFSDSSHLCFSICPYCRKFDFKISFDHNYISYHTVLYCIKLNYITIIYIYI